MPFVFRTETGSELTYAEVDGNLKEVEREYLLAVSSADIAVASSNYKNDWNMLSGAFAPPASASWAGNFWMLLSPVTEITTEEPGVSAVWRLIPLGGLNPVFSVYPDAGALDGTETVPINKTGTERTTVQRILDWILARSNTWTGKQTFSAIDLASVNGGQIGGFRNKIHNGNFSINQRAVSGTVTLAAGVYGHDRYKAGASGCTYTFAASDNITTLTISAGSLQQIIEGIDLQSGTHILSWGGTAQGKIAGGAYGAKGRTGTATGGTNLTVEFSTGTLSLVQLEMGSVASAFEYRSRSVELPLCQRFCRPIGVAVMLGVKISTNSMSFSMPLAVEMRAAPTITAPSAWVVGLPSSVNQVGAYGYVGGNFMTISGALSVANASTKTQLALSLNAGTSFSDVVNTSLSLFFFDEKSVFLSADL